MAVGSDVIVADPSAARPVEQRSVRLGGRDVRVVGPKARDPRLQLALTTITILVIGIGWLDFRLSIPQVVLPVVTCAAVDVLSTYRRAGALVWPASAMQTATSTVLILRVTGFEADRPWSFEGWYYFVGIAVAGLLSKVVFRYRGSHVFNPSNVALVAAFLVLGADRIEPLDFWWGPFDWSMFTVYAVIVFGGVTLCRRLRLLELAVAFYATFLVGVGVLAILGQSITAQWSLTPITGLHYWWILVTSPEVLIFLFFMITDPRTTPSGRLGRIGFGCAVAVASTLLSAPWPTEFGTKVGLLAGLLVVTGCRPIVDVVRRARAARRSTSADSTFDVTRRNPFVPTAIACVGVVAFIVSVALAGAPNRSAAGPPPTPAPSGFVVDPASLPPVSVDPEVAGLSAELATPAGARDLAAALAFDLAVEAEAARTRDPSLLTAVAHGARLEERAAAIEAVGDGDIVVPSYAFDALHLSIVYPGGPQSGANAGLTATGTVTLTTHSATGEVLSSRDEPVEVMFSMREFEGGRWLVTDTPRVADR